MPLTGERPAAQESSAPLERAAEDYCTLAYVESADVCVMGRDAGPPRPHYQRR
jgi:hypothetical protein